MTARAVIALGANLGDRLATLTEASMSINELGTIVAISPLYDTDPVGYADQPRFLNGVLVLDTDLEPLELLDELQRIEQVLGRVRTFRNAPRTLDLDLLFYGDRTLDTDRLVLPHPRLHERAFVLAPLNDVAPDLVHPSIGKTVRELLAALPDRSGVIASSARIDLGL